ncbi:zinc finger MYM-type protein 5-like [Drosophila elegans]|uniref:zinc finger MYM-type protein 5-like n=1 Tax=Drosophila elegans TaxID=30023 RepID=UPI001BC845C6|nr:zinc finger MYM-type protein 5-like [Drosophila elegans]
MKRIKPSGAQFKKIRAKKQHTKNLSKEFMLNYVKSHNKEISDTSNNPSVSESNLENPSQHFIDECTSDIENEAESLSKEILEVENAGQSSVGIDSEKQHVISVEENVETVLSQENSGTENIELSINKDIGSWPEKISQSLRDLIVNTGTESLQNKNGPFHQDDSGRSLNKAWFQRTHKNGEKTERTWMCYSVTKNALFCLCCKLFPCKNYQSSFSNETGFSSWKKLNPRIEEHESSRAHRFSFLEWKDMERSLKKGGLLDDRLQ